MNLREIKRLITIVAESKVSHFSIESEGVKIEIKKELNGHSIAQTVSTELPVGVIPQAIVPQGPSVSVEESGSSSQEDDSLVAIKAQMVGTFYASANPDAEPFVLKGATLEKGQDVCIIEAMKLFNEIESEVSGVVEKVCVKSGEPVEYGQELFLIRVNE